MRKGVLGFACLAVVVVLAIGVTSRAQTSPAVSPGSSVPTPNPSIRDGAKVVSDGSGTMNGWSLLIIGASVTAIIGTSYLRPPKICFRLSYLLFIPGWSFLAASVYYGNRVSRRYMAAMLAKDDGILRETVQAMSHEFSSQIGFMQLGLIIFAVWLAIFLVWWVFYGPQAENGMGGAKRNENQTADNAVCGGL
ncbi:MAG: hypothetical protein ACREDR_36735 [Blastocatellia bacterium]